VPPLAVAGSLAYALTHYPMHPAAVKMTPYLRGLDVSNTALDIRTVNRVIDLLPQLVVLAANGIGWELQEEEEGDNEKETEKVKGSEEEAIVISSQILEVFWLMDYHEPINNLIFEV